MLDPKAEQEITEIQERYRALTLVPSKEALRAAMMWAWYHPKLISVPEEAEKR
ncbi:MAG: hypothetical protein IT349_19350 [Candidatus Eisenbacteria bacterium]|nr:hypothetical protein [Candidatus Eisenbacteria bacterium]